MSDHWMLPTAHPFEYVSVDPISSWSVKMPDGPNKKLPILVVLRRKNSLYMVQTFVWLKYKVSYPSPIDPTASLWKN